jgi:type I restriction enzyme S subunit
MRDNTWPRVRLRDIAVARGLIGGPFGSSLGLKDYVPSGVPVIRGTNLSGGSRLVAGPFVFVSETKAGTLERNIAVPGDVVATQRGTLGQVALIPPVPYEKYVISQSQMALRVNPSMATAEYVCFALSASDAVAEIESRKVATANPHINLGIFASLEIPLPPLAEQRRIVDLIGSVDAVLGTAQAAAGANSAVRGAVLAELFADGDEAQVGDVVELVYGRALPERMRTGDGYPVYGAAGMVGRHSTPDVADGPVIIVGRKGVHARASAAVAPRSDESLSGIDGYRGEGGAGTVRWSSSPCTVIDTAFRALPKRPLDLRLLFWILRAADLPSQTTKTTLPGLSREVAARVRVVLPQIERAAPLIDLLDALDEVLIAGYKRAACLQSVRSALLTDLLSGSHDIPRSYDRFLDGAA